MGRGLEQAREWGEAGLTALWRRLPEFIRSRLTSESRQRVPLAWRNLTADRERMVRSVSGIAFAVVLMLMQLGVQKAFMDSALAVVHALDADLILMNPQKIRFGTKAPFPRVQLSQALGIEGVASAHPLYAEWARSQWKNPQTHGLFKMQVLAFEPDKPVFLMDEVEEWRDALKLPDTVLADRRGRRFLGDMEPGVETELGLRRVRVLDTFPLGPDFLIDGSIITSDRTFLKLFPPRAYLSADNPMPPRLTEVEFGLIKLKADHDVAEVQRQLRAILPETVAVITKERLIEIETAYQSGVAPVGPIFNLGTAIGFVVGMLIAYQILHSDLSDQLPQYATLKAMGYSNEFLVRTVLEQSLVYGLVGYGAAWLVANVLFFVVAEITLLPLSMTLSLVGATLVLTLVMCAISGLVAVRHILRADPAEVF